MSETKIIPTSTSVSVLGTDITIHTEYVEDLPNTLKAEITSDVGIINGVNFTNGELLITMKNYPEKINYTINGMGELIVYATTPDLDKYSINENGDLIWE